jgi:uncharacterized protein (DUF58 family)
MDDALLDAAFLARLEKLALRSRMRSTGARSGAHRSVRRGESLEFVDHRDYVPGDDLRHLDWHLAGRLDRLFIKLFEAKEDRTVSLLLDRSASMTGAKWTAARKAAAAMAFASLCGLDRVQILAVDRAAEAEGRPARGRSSIHRFFRYLGGASAAGETDLARALRTLAPARAGAVTVLISDLWDPAGLEGAFARLAHRGGDVHVLHVIDRRELSPPLTGDLTLVDAETGAELNVTVDKPTRQAYLAAAEAWMDAAAAAAHRRGIAYFRLDASEPVEDTLLSWLVGSCVNR